MSGAVAYVVAATFGTGMVIALVGACNAIMEPAPSPAPVNMCGSADATCGGFAEAGCVHVGSNNLCTTEVSPPAVFVISVPTLATTVPGMTYALTANQIYGSAALTCPFVSEQDLTCITLPALGDTNGAYFASQAMQQATGRNVGAASPSIVVTLPVTVTLWPQWLLGGASYDARELNLPLPPVVASVGVSPPSVSVPVAGLDDNMDMGSLFGWRAGLPPLPDSPAYVGVVHVDPPFDDGYPDQVYSVQPATVPNAAPLPVGIITPATPPVVSRTSVAVTRAAGLEGWSAFVRENPSTIVPPRIVSSRWTFGKGSTTQSAGIDFIDFAGFGTGQNDYSFVIEPPLGSRGLPEFADPILFAPLLASEPYPALPPLVTLSGAVVSPEDTPVGATLLFYSTNIDTLDPTGACTRPRVARLTYQAQVSTDDQATAQGTVGRFSVQLPPGSYNYLLEPSAASGYAKTVVQENVQVGKCAGPGATSVTIHASRRMTVSGGFVTADGRPLANASVDFSPSALLVAGATATVAGSPSALSRWPRPFTTTTGAAGGFTLDVDPGLYDITARPQDGTNFAWLVAPGHLIIANTHFAPPFTLPAPAFIDVTVHDPANDPLPNATVQAYAFTSTTPPVAILIGEALTDTQGRFTMTLSGFAQE